MIRELGRAVVVGWLVLGLSGSARAGGVADEAELNFQLGFDAYDQGDYRTALAHFLESNRLVPNANVAYNIARMFEKLAKYPDAYRWYLDTLQQGPDAETTANVNAALERIAPQVAVFDVQTNPPGASIFVDRTDLGAVGTSPTKIAYPAGTYKILVELPGFAPAATEPQTVKIGTTTPVRLDLVEIVGTAHITANEADAAVHVGAETEAVACKVPCDLPLRPGLHILYVTKDGFRSVPLQVEITAQKTSQSAAELVPLTGSLVVSSSERDALIEIDGRPVGYTPAVVPNVRVGSRHVRVTLRGYLPIEKDVDITDGAETDLRDLDLVPIRQVTAASRLPESVETAPSSVSIISSQELRAFGYPTIYEALRGVRGMSNSFDTVYSAIGVRGLGQSNDFGNKLLILSDGATLNDDILYQSFIGYDGRVDLGDVDHIEVVRGAGSVLYGTGAVSGVVNLVTRSTEDPTSGQAQIGTADNGVAHGRGSFNAKFGDHSGMWASVGGARSDGREVTLDVPQRGGGTAPLVAEGADTFDAATTAGRLWAKDFTIQWFGTHRAETITTGAYGTSFTRPGTIWVDDRYLAEARYEPKLSDRVQLFARTYVNQYTFDGTYDYDARDPDQLFIFKEVYVGRWAGLEPRIVYRSPSDSLRLSVGTELDYNWQASLFGSRKFHPDNPYLDENSPYLIAAAYTLLDVAPSDVIRFSLGARLDYWNYTTFAGTQQVAGQNFLNANPRVAVIVTPDDANIVKLMGGRAFRAPSIYELTYNDGGYNQERSDYNGNVLQPEADISGELEYTHKFGEEWAGVASTHALYANHLIETVPTEPGADVVYYKNTTAPQVFGGLDLELRRDFARGWMFDASYGYLVAQYTQAPDPELSGRVPNAPWHQASIRGIAPLYEPLANLAVRATLEAPRRINLQSDATTDPAVVADVVLSGADHQTGLSYHVGVYNLFDWDYATPVTDTFAAPVMPQSGRTLLLDVGIQR